MNWTISSACSCGDCVAVALDTNTVYVRNTLRPDTILTFTPDEWNAFLAGARNGEFDLEETP